MRFVGPVLFAVALGVCAVLVFAHGVRSRVVLAQTLAGLWLGGEFLYLVWLTQIYPNYVSPLRHLPTVKGKHWLFGHGKLFLPGTEEPLREWVINIPHEGGLLRYLWWFNDERVLISSSKALAEVLVAKSYIFQRPQIVKRFLSPVLGVGILLTEGEVHKVQRRDLAPAFAFRHLKDLYPVFWRKAREGTQAMTALANGDGIAQWDAVEWSSRCTLDILGAAGLGVEFGAIQDPTNPLVTAYKIIMSSQTLARLLLLIALPNWFLCRLPLQKNYVIRQSNETIRNICKAFIRDKKNKMAANKERTDVDILSVALESGRFSDENLVDQLMTFLAAGHDTTASALTWATYALSCYPDVQNRLRQEVRERLPPVDEDTDIAAADIDKMPYLQAFCNEVLRLFPSVPRTSRQAVEDTTIQGVFIPKGTTVMLAPWATNTNPSLWGSDALEFKPERWLAKDAADIKTASLGGASSVYAFMSFLHGPRSCIGVNFARAEFACLVAAWVGRFEFDLVNPEMKDKSRLVIRHGVTAQPKGGLPIKTRIIPGF